MYWHWWLLIWMIDEIYVFTLVVSDTTDWCDWCIETGGSWYGWLMLWDWWFLIWPSNLHLSPNCWHGISNISMYIHLNCIVLMSHILVWPNTYCKQCPNFTPLIVGSIYPIKLYISYNCTLPNPVPEGHKETLYLTFISKLLAWHISNINIYIQLNYTPQIVGSLYPIQLDIL